jgi:hypothetical protein
MITEYLRNFDTAYVPRLLRHTKEKGLSGSAVHWIGAFQKKKNLFIKGFEVEGFPVPNRSPTRFASVTNIHPFYFTAQNLLHFCQKTNGEDVNMLAYSRSIEIDCQIFEQRGGVSTRGISFTKTEEVYLVFNSRP